MPTWGTSWSLPEWSNNIARLLLYMFLAARNSRENRPGRSSMRSTLGATVEAGPGTRWGPTGDSCPTCCYKFALCLEISWHWPMEGESCPNPVIFCCIIGSVIIFLSLIDLAYSWLPPITPKFLSMSTHYSLFLTNQILQLDFPTMFSNPLVILAMVLQTTNFWRSTRWVVGMHRKRGVWSPNEC